MAKVIIRPTLPADLPHVIAEPLPCRIRALTAVLLPSPDQGEDEAVSEERILGVGGVAFLPGGCEAFVQAAPDAYNYPVAFHRAGLMAMKMFRDIGIREVVASCDEGNPAAVRWLDRLGFARAQVQFLPGKIVWLWRRDD